MARPAVLSVEDKFRLVCLSHLGRDERSRRPLAGRRCRSSRSRTGSGSSSRAASRASPTAAGRARTRSEQRLEAEIEELKAALGEAHVELRVWKKSGGVPPGAYEELEVIRLEAGMSTARFCRLVGVPERSYRRWQQRERQGQPVKGPWPTPSADRIEPIAVAYADRYPQWGSRTIATLMRIDGTTPPTRPSTGR